MSIQRYEFRVSYTWDDQPCTEYYKSDDGRFVLYKDHTERVFNETIEAVRLTDELAAERKRADRAEAALNDARQSARADAKHFEGAIADVAAERDALRERVARLVGALEAITMRVPIMASTGDYRTGQLHALEACAEVARTALESVNSPLEDK